MVGKFITLELDEIVLPTIDNTPIDVHILDDGEDSELQDTFSPVLWE